MATSFIEKILSCNYSDLNKEEMMVILNHHDVFGVTAKTAKQSIKLIDKNFDDVKKAVIPELYNPYYILEGLDIYEIEENGICIQFKKDFYAALNQMDSFKICILIDRMGLLMKSKSRVRFFGGSQRIASAYHEINKIFGLVIGTTLSFKIFGKGISNYFPYFDYERLDKKKMADCLEKWISHHYYLLSVLANKVLISTKEEIEQAGRYTRDINKTVSHVTDVLAKEPKSDSGHGAGTDRRFSLYLEKYYVDDDEEE